MKRIIVLLLILLFFYGCSSRFATDKIIMHFGFDFTKYTAKGFLFTPEPYVGNYESIGILKTVIYAAVKHTKAQVQNPGADPYLKEEWKIDAVDAEEAIEEMYKKAVGMGADAIIRFEIKSTYYMNGTMYVPGYEVYGFAIKRK